MGLGLVVAGWLFLAYVLLVATPSVGTFGFDAYAYWNVALPNPYTVEYGALGSFNYSPPIALVADWFGALEWWVFVWMWTLLLVGTVTWLAGSPGWVFVAFAIPFVAIELHHGNIHILLAAAIVLGFRHPWAWAFVLLTKPTVVVALLWFAVRREWRSLGIALGATAAIAGLSYVVAPSLWYDYLAAMVANVGSVPSTVNLDVPLAIRLPAAALLVTWGALTGRRWTVVVSGMLALPVLWIGAGAMLVGLISEVRGHLRAPMPVSERAPAHTEPAVAARGIA